jgi:protein-L-isoaspartate(D-aspartate) O-methyltransferase
MMVGAPRAYFMDLAQEEFWKAYCVDVPESLSNGQTISAESVVFLMTVMLNPEPNDRVFEVGTGSGRQAALLSLLCREVHTVERIRSLYESARQRLTNLQRLATGKNIHVYLGDATEKFPEALTGQGFDKIMVTASPTYEQLCAIARNLREEGLMVAPLTIPGKQEMPLVLYQKKNNELVELFRLDGFMFVPLLTGTTEGDSAAKRPILGVDGITLDIIKSLEQAIAHLDTKRVPLKNRLLTASSVQVSLTERGLRISELGTRLILDRLTIGRERLLISVQPGVYHLISRTGSNTPHPTPLTDSLVDQKKAESTTAAFNAAA